MKIGSTRRREMRKIEEEKKKANNANTCAMPRVYIKPQN